MTKKRSDADEPAGFSTDSKGSAGLRRAQEARDASSARYFDLYNLAPVGYIVLSEQGLILETNSAAATLLGKEKGELVKMPIARFIFPADRELYDLHSRLPLEAGSPQAYDLRMVKNDGSAFWAHLETSAARDGLGASSAGDSREPPVRRFVLSDITELKQAEEAMRRTAEELREKNDELNRFIYAVSHDLKSPLVTIQTFQGHLERDLRSQDAARIEMDLGYIRNAADRMRRLLDELPRLSRAGQTINPSEEAPLQEIVKEALDLVAGRITRRGVRVELTEEPIMLTGERTRLVELFQNLLDNAAKFMGDEPAPRIEIGVDQVGEELEMYVRDNGIGIDPQFRPMLFSPFHKFDSGSEGMGLGLALARRIVETHGGRIRAESEGPGRGMNIKFTLAKTKRARAENALLARPRGPR